MEFCIEGGCTSQSRLLDSEWSSKRRLEAKRYPLQEALAAKKAQFRIGTITNIDRNVLGGSVYLFAFFVDIEIRNLKDLEVVPTKECGLPTARGPSDHNHSWRRRL